jgi:antitoxin (DNA-binding transcriptional repressor) of toxin-antitoxin stability system
VRGQENTKWAQKGAACAPIVPTSRPRRARNSRLRAKRPSGTRAAFTGRGRHGRRERDAREQRDPRGARRDQPRDVDETPIALMMEATSV